MSSLRFAGPPRRSYRTRPSPTVASTTCAPRCAARCGPAASPSADTGANRATACAGWCCCSTSAGRWSRTPAACCASSMPRWPAVSGSRRSRWARDSRASPASCRAATPTRRCSRRAPECSTGAAAHAWASASPGSTTSGAFAAWHAAPSSSSCPTAGTGAIRPCWASRWPRLDRIAFRTVWVNPLKVTPGYAPLARGMAAALPYVDAFVEGHSIAAMEELAATIAALRTSTNHSGGAVHARTVG